MSQLLPLSSTTLSGLLPVTLAVLAFTYTVYGAIWRLRFSPIAKFPGPWLAALTFWNEFYYDVFLGGKYTFKIAEYHERYGERCLPPAPLGQSPYTGNKLNQRLRSDHSHQSLRNSHQGPRVR